MTKETMPPLTKVTLERSGPIATVTINRPKVLNALNHTVLTELDQVFGTLALDDQLRGIVLTGAGERAFVAGADISELEALDADGGRRASLFGQRVFRKIERLGKPVVAAIQGYALGGGCELALACTLRVAAEGAKLGLPETTLGIIPGYGGTQRLARLVGLGRAYALVLTGDPVDAEEALAMGLVNRVVPPAELLAAATQLAERIASRGPLAVTAALAAMRHGIDGSLEAGLELEANAFGVLCGTEDMHEGMRAFLEKRSPAFAGR